MTQRTLEFDTAAPKLTGQRKAILDRLKFGPATSQQLNAICFRFSARIHELRKQGYDIKTEMRDGYALYTLTQNG